MATIVNIEVKGLRELGERMKALGLDFKQGKNVARATTNAGAQVIKKLAQQKAPVSDFAETPRIPPGELKRNIIVRYNRRSKLSSEHAVTVRSKGKGVIGTPYTVGVQQEFGNVNHGPQAFMRPAIDQGKQQAIEAMKKRLLKRIEQAENGK